MRSKMYFKTLFNTISLPVGISISVGLALLIVKLFPSPSTEGSGWASVGDMFAAGVLALFFCFMVLIVWLIKIFRDIYYLRTNKAFVLVNTLLIVSTLSLILYFLLFVSPLTKM